MFIYFVSVDLGSGKKVSLIDFIEGNKTFDEKLESIFTCREVACTVSYEVKCIISEHFGEKCQAVFNVGIKRKNNNSNFIARVLSDLGYPLHEDVEGRFYRQYVSINLSDISPQLVSFILLAFRIQDTTKKENDSYEKIIKECINRWYELADIFDYLPYGLFPLWCIGKYGRFFWDEYFPGCIGVSDYTTRLMYTRDALIEEFMEFLNYCGIIPEALNLGIDGYYSFQTLYDERL